MSTHDITIIRGAVGSQEADSARLFILLQLYSTAVLSYSRARQQQSKLLLDHGDAGAFKKQILKMRRSAKIPKSPVVRPVSLRMRRSS
jgi:hypothetical protein